MAKRKQHAKLGFGTDIVDPLDAIHIGQGKRIRLEDVPLEGAEGNLQTGNREYNDARYLLKGSTTSNNQAAFLEGGYLVWSGSGLVFNRPKSVYLLPGIDTPITVAAASNITLDAADPTHPRFDIPVWDVNANFFIIKGTPSANPAVPAVTDPLTQISGPAILIPAGSLTPDPSITSIVAYDENVEYATGYSGVGTVTFTANTTPQNGTLHIRATEVQDGLSLIFTAPVNITFADIDGISFYAYLLSQFFAGNELAVQFFNNSGTAVSNQLNISLNKTNTTSYQFLSLLISEFTLTALQFRQLRIIFRRTKGAQVHPGFLVDRVLLNGGIEEPVPVDAGNNIVQVINVDSANLSGGGTIEQQVCDYLNATTSIDYSNQYSKLNIIVT